uniref:hypothetical protein n=1 Tax=Veillonella magna TaxID=464322 RepID=UPI00402ABE1F
MEEKKPRKCEAVVKAVKRYFEALKGKDYKTPEEAVDDAKYLTRINIVNITISVIINLFNLSRIVWLLLGYR